MTIACETSEGSPPLLPRPRGPRSAALVDRLRKAPHSFTIEPLTDSEHDRALDDDDVQLALYVCYELHYRGFAGVDDEWEWSASLLEQRRTLEASFETALRRAVPRSGASEEPPATTIARLIEESTAPSLSAYMEQLGTLGEMCEFAVHRSAYQLKEADPHTWALPRLDGDTQAAMAAIQYDEYGSGRGPHRHSALFATTLGRLGLDPRYGAYVDRLPGVTLATTNLMSFFGLHRRWRGALLGHLAAFEMTSVGPMARYARALRRLGVSEDAATFYSVHVEADSEHELIARRMVDQFALEHPGLAGDVAFGARCLFDLEGRFAQHLLMSWAAGRTSLRDS